MDDQEKAQLLLEETNGRESVAQLQARLENVGEKLSSIGNALQKSSSEVRFIIATDSIQQTHGGLESLWFSTDDIPSWLELQSLTQNLRDSQLSLKHTRKLLEIQGIFLP